MFNFRWQGNAGPKDREHDGLLHDVKVPTDDAAHVVNVDEQLADLAPGDGHGMVDGVFAEGKVLPVLLHVLLGHVERLGHQRSLGNLCLRGRSDNLEVFRD